MKNYVPNPNWQENFLSNTKQHYQLAQKYCDYFNTSFKSQIKQFGYFKHDQDGYFTAISNLLKHEELYLEHKGYQDDPHHVDFRKIQSGFSFDCPNRCAKNVKHDAFRHAMYQHFGTYGTLCIVKKKIGYYETFWWGFHSNPSAYPKTQCIILNDFFSNIAFVKKCLSSFQQELLPIIETQCANKVNFNDLKGKYYKKQSPIIKPHYHTKEQETQKRILFAHVLDNQSAHALLNDQEIQCIAHFVKTGKIIQIANTFDMHVVKVNQILNQATQKLYRSHLKLNQKFEALFSFFGIS